MSFKLRFNNLISGQGFKNVDFGRTPVTNVAYSNGKFVFPENALSTHLTRIIAYWLAEAFTKSDLVVKNKKTGDYVDGHEIERAYEFPVGGSGPFWRATMQDYLHYGLWFHHVKRTSAGRRSFQVSWIPKQQIEIPNVNYVSASKTPPIWRWTPPHQTVIDLKPNDFVYGVWDFDPDNPFNGKTPLRHLRNIINLDRAALLYEFDAFLHTGGQGLLIKDPSLGNRQRFKTEEELLQYRVQLQEHWTMVTSGEGRSRPIVTDGKETEIDTYGVPISDIDMGRVYSFTAEMILALFQIPPSAVGVRLDRDPTYANSRTWETVAFERGVLPRQKEFAERLGQKFLTKAELDKGLRLEFKTPDAVRAALEDQGLLERILLERVNKEVSVPSEVRPLLKDIKSNPEIDKKLDDMALSSKARTTPMMLGALEGNERPEVEDRLVREDNPDPAVSRTGTEAQRVRRGNNGKFDEN